MPGRQETFPVLLLPSTLPNKSPVSSREQSLQQDTEAPEEHSHCRVGMEGQTARATGSRPVAHSAHTHETTHASAVQYREDTNSTA